MAVPNKLIAVDIFSSRLCVFILNSSWASSITKALETPSFRKSAELKRHFYQMSYDGHGVLGTMERRVRLSHWLSRGNADSAL
jgi:hypothetical protein